MRQQRHSFKWSLKENGHRWIPNLKLRERHITAATNDENPLYLSIPFVNDMANTLIRRALKPLGFNLRIVHQHILNPRVNIPPTRSGKCDIRNCPIKSNLCYRKMVVYETTYDKCLKSYIGSTKKFLHERMREHHTMKDSSIYKHKHSSCSATWSYKILAQAYSTPDLCFKEALFIKDNQPSLNKKEDVFSLSRITLV